MASTLPIDSFINNNIRERTRLSEAAEIGGQSLTVESTTGYAVGDIVYVGELSREGCEKAVVDAVTDEMTLALESPLTLPHGRFQPVTGVLGDKIRIYEAANVDGSVPADDDFEELTTRDIDPDEPSTYYRDPDGTSARWYKWTNFDQLSGDETPLDEAVAVRGQDYGNYAPLPDIRERAGFSGNNNVKDSYIDRMRRAAQTEINGALSTAYVTPFTTVPAQVREFTIELAALLIKADQYGPGKVEKEMKDIRARMAAANVTDESGESLANGSVDSYFGDDDRAFTEGMKF